MDYTKGGRGKRAPYKSVVVRVPAPIKGIVDGIVEAFREKVEDGSIKDYEDTQELLPDLIEGKDVTSLSKEEAIEEAKKILRSKKGNKEQQFEKLLQVICGGDVFSNKKQQFEKLLQLIYGGDVSLD